MRAQICFDFILLLIPTVVCTDSHLQKLERTVEKLQDIVLSVTTENAKYKKFLDDLTEKVFDQERRIENLEKSCKKDDDFYPELKTKKTKVVNFSYDDHPFVERLDAEKTIPIARILQKTPSKRVMDSRLGNVAFYSYLSESLHEPSFNHVLVFNNAVTNIGGHYNRFSGVFTAPQSGTYVFTFTGYCSTDGHFSLFLVANANVFDGVICNAEGANWYRSVSSTAVAHINQGDSVFIKTHNNLTVHGQILSYNNARTSFAGWFLF